jgi:hypothetical protein
MQKSQSDPSGGEERKLSLASEFVAIQARKERLMKKKGISNIHGFSSLKRSRNLRTCQVWPYRIGHACLRVYVPFIIAPG